MTPGEILGWVGAIALSIVIVVFAVAIVAALIRGIRNPTSTRKPIAIIRKGDNS